MKLKYSVYGNCQANAIAQCLNQVSEFKKKYDYIPLKAVQSINSNDLESIQNKFSGLDLIIYQHIADNYRIPELSTTQIRKFLPDSAVKISFPSLYYNGYFPHLARLSQLMSRNNMVHDCNILAGYVKNISKNNLYKIISDENFYSKEESFNLHENSLSNLEKRELTNKVDIQLSDFIKNNYQKNKLFNHFDHPTGFIFSFLVKAILKKLGIAYKYNEIKLIENSNFLDSMQYLIYLFTENHLNLKFHDFRDKKNAVIRGKKYHYQEVIDLFYKLYAAVDNKTKLSQSLQEKKPFTLEKIDQYVLKEVKRYIPINSVDSTKNKIKLKALVHIGFHKTGSSSIQTSLRKSELVLTKNGFFYPVLANNSQHWPLSINYLKKPENHHLIKEMGFSDEIELNQWLLEIDHELDVQLDKFSNQQAHTCILSTEDFSIISANKISEFHKFLDQRFDSIKIIAYIRPVDTYYVSIIQQWAKGGNRALKDLPLPHRFNSKIKQKIDPYLKEFSQENISVIKFSPESLFEKEVVKDFQQRFLITENQDVIELEYIKANESITAVGVLFLLLCSQKIPRYIDNRLNPKWKAVRQAIIEIPPSETLPKLKMPATWAEIIKQNHQEEYLWLEDTFFDGVRGIFSSPVTTGQEQQQVTRAEFEAWLMSYLNPAALEEINQHLTQAKVLTSDELSDLFDFIDSCQRK